MPTTLRSFSLRALRPYAAVLSLVFGLGLSGCVSHHEMMLHVAVADIDSEKPSVKFYRIKIRGESANVKADFKSGFYDTNSLRAMFGEVSAAGSTHTAGSVGTHTFTYDAGSNSWRHVNPRDLFAVIYGADAQALTDAISAYGDSNEVGAALGQLLARAAGGNTATEVAAAEDRKNKTQTAANTLAKSFREAADNLTSKLATTAPTTQPTLTTGGPNATPTHTSPSPAPAPGNQPNLTTGATAPNAQPTNTSPTASPTLPNLPPPSEVYGMLRTVAVVALAQLGSSTQLEEDHAKAFETAAGVHEVLLQNEGTK